MQHPAAQPAVEAVATPGKGRKTKGKGKGKDKSKDGKGSDEKLGEEPVKVVTTLEKAKALQKSVFLRCTSSL